jgi:hypothetical protein
MTIDDLAVAAQGEFETIRSEMATKEELKSSTKEILRAIESIDGHLSAYVSLWNEDFAKLRGLTQELDSRVRFLEKPH